jgi:ribA/ribD-fused uncharacterized protein
MINKFEGKYRFLSNFYPCWITLEDAEYPSVEHAYQAAKTTHEQLRLMFQEPIMTAGEAKKAGQRLKLRDDWEEIKINVMRECIRSKFSQKKFKELLLATGEENLVEGNSWGDTFWGVCKDVGQNWLGKLLMEFRKELNDQGSTI